MIVADTCPLTELARVERLVSSVARLFTRVAIPPAVRTDLSTFDTDLPRDSSPSVLAEAYE